MADLVSRLAAGLVPLALVATAHAASFADPMRPPLDDGASSAVEGPRLESVLIAPDRRVAVINGEQYTVGSKFRDGAIVRISESEVVVRRGAQDEILQLIPRPAKRSSGSVGKEK